MSIDSQLRIRSSDIVVVFGWRTCILRDKDISRVEN